MSPIILNLIISLITGAAGGNAAGALLKQFSLGPIGNSLAGIVGGGLGGELLGALIHGGVQAGPASGLDIGGILSQVVGGGVGGGALTIVAGLVRQFIGGQKPSA